jgi:hypothetical protein
MKREYLTAVRPPLDTLILCWDAGYTRVSYVGSARVSYEQGSHVAENSAEISRILGSVAPPNLASIDRRIRVVFGDDPSREYTNQFIVLMTFLCRIKGAIVFDPQQKDIMTL